MGFFPRFVGLACIAVLLPGVACGQDARSKRPGAVPSALRKAMIHGAAELVRRGEQLLRSGKAAEARRKFRDAERILAAVSAPGGVGGLRKPGQGTAARSPGVRLDDVTNDVTDAVAGEKSARGKKAVGARAKKKPVAGVADALAKKGKRRRKIY